jgi:hypothetical protein
MGNRLERYVTILNLVGQNMRMNNLRNVVMFAWMGSWTVNKRSHPSWSVGGTARG